MLEENSWIVIHCEFVYACGLGHLFISNAPWYLSRACACLMLLIGGAMRHGGRRCDIPFEVKRILCSIDGVSLQDEVVMVPEQGGNMMRVRRSSCAPDTLSVV